MWMYGWMYVWMNYHASIMGIGGGIIMSTGKWADMGAQVERGFAGGVHGCGGIPGYTGASSL